MLIKEIKTTILIAILLGFGRAISEVGAVMMVGGNIRFKTRVMTTAIVLETRQGNYETGLILGLALLVISLFIQGSAHYFLRGNQDD
jgi:tungstate transport system permease protein